MLYDIAFLIFSICYLPALIFKGKLHKDFAERFGIYGKAKKDTLASAKGAIWLQAASVGEVALCKAIIPLIKNRFPDRRIIVSTITRAGNILAKSLFSKQAIIIYFPLDFSFIVKHVAGIINPGIYVMVETEIWPNLLKELSRRSIPSVLINGRISDASFEKYKLARPFLSKTFDRIDAFCMQSDADAEKIMYLGAGADKVNITGNMKFDVEIAADDKSVLALRGLLGLGDGGKLFVCGSTHAPEEEIVLNVFKKLSEEFPHLKLLIAPRHIERASEIANLVRTHGFEPLLLSAPAARYPLPAARYVYILDMIGRLKDAYAISDLVFIGGSLAKHGGQNPIEPAVFEKPIIFGPYMFNFKGIAGALLAGQGAIQVHCEKDLIEMAGVLLRNPGQAAELGEKAKNTVLKNRGATAENLKTIEAVIKR